MRATELGVELVLVGRKEEIEKYLKAEDYADGNIEIVDARDGITMEDDPSTATRRKKDVIHDRRAYHAQKRRGRRNVVSAG